MGKKNNLFISVSLLLAGILVSNCGTSDLRPDSIKDGISAEETARGKTLLEDLQKTYRRDLWKEKKTLTVTYKDHWPSLFPRIMAMPWPKNDHKVKLAMVLGKDDAYLTFLEDPKQEEVWGIQQWATYKKTKDGQVIFEQDDDIWFWLPTYSYFSQLPYRIVEGGIVAYAGEVSADGSQYDTVFVTWNKPEPLDDIDQYLVYINKQNGYIDKVDYTIRDMGKWMVGAIYYDDTRLVDGIPIAHKQSAGDKFNGDDVVHQAEFISVKFSGSLDENKFYPDKSKVVSKYKK